MHFHHPRSLRAMPMRTLLPGELYCCREPRYLGTLLGSCVAVCLWDMRQRIGGMNHYLLPNRPSNAKETFRFGDVAVPALIEGMLELGGNLRHLQAKLFGGAYVLHAGSPEYAVGRRNIEVAVAELQRHRIPIVASHLSGTQGLVIRQCTDCGKVWVRPVGSSDVSTDPPVGRDDTQCLSEDIAAAMTALSEHRLPPPIRNRQIPVRSLRCDSCVEPPADWRRS